MKSSDAVYAFLAIYMPLTILTALVFLFRALLPFSAALVLISGGISALAAMFFCNLAKDAKPGQSSAAVRGGLIVMALAYFAASVLRIGTPWEIRFIPNLSVVAASLGALYVWVSAVSLNQLFNARKRFEAYAESCRGEQLYRALYEDADLLQYIEKEITKARRNYLFQLILIFIITLVRVVYTGPLPLGLYFLLSAILLCGVCIFGFFGIIRREHYHAAEGLPPSALDRSKRMAGIGVFSLVAIVAAVVLSGDKSLLPVSLLSGFLGGIVVVFAWIIKPIALLFGLLSKLLDTGSETEPQPIEPLDFSLFEPVEESGPSPVWGVLKYAFIAIAAAAFIWFMIAPLLNRIKSSAGNVPFFKRLGRLMAEWFKGLFAAWTSFCTFVRSKGSARKLRQLDSGEIQRATDALLGAYSPAKKREMKQSVTLFARLILWGGEVRQVMWKPSLAPGEYCHILAAAPLDTDTSVEQLNEKIIRCGELFEKALYSAEVLSDTERKEFKDLVEEIVLVV